MSILGRSCRLALELIGRFAARAWLLCPLIWGQFWANSVIAADDRLASLNAEIQAIKAEVLVISEALPSEVSKPENPESGAGAISLPPSSQDNGYLTEISRLQRRAAARPLSDDERLQLARLKLAFGLDVEAGFDLYALEGDAVPPRDRSRAWFELADAYHRKGHYRAAEEALNHAASDLPEDLVGSYQLLQSYDYLQLHRRHECVLQTGGSDQWGNITAGVDLVRRVEGAHVHALTTPLITKADGTKFGKTESGTVWLDSELTSPYAFFQFWLNADDRDVPVLLRTFSFKDRWEIDELIAATQDRPHERAAQRALAEEMTALVHGEREMLGAQAAGRVLFGQGEFDEVPESTLSAALAETPHAEVSAGELEGDLLPAVDELFVRAGLVESKGAARRAVKEGGAYLNNERLSDPGFRASRTDLVHGQWLVLRRGKRTVGGIRLT